MFKSKKGGRSCVWLILFMPLLRMYTQLKRHTFEYTYTVRMGFTFRMCTFSFEGDVYVPALWQGPLCPSNTQFPVVIFSHGLGGNRTTNTTVCCELASQGFIVASLEHRYGPPVIF